MIGRLYHKAKQLKFKSAYLPKSLYYSLRYRMSGFPIYTHWKSNFVADRSSIIKIKNHLIIGHLYGLLCRQPAYVEVKSGATLEIDGKAELGKGTVIIVNNNANLYIGDNTYIAGDSKIYAVKEIRIGSDCALSWGLTIIDSDFHTLLPDQKEKVNSISIGNHVWIGCNVTVLKGVTIGDNSVVAANSVVNKDVPPNTLVGGSPAEVIKTDVDWEL
ncbi:acyltransferase [Sporosarcina sp. SAFN-015]|uniref:acyltransferase n=1 Tax=Sporosarcina sp. SAFN-015 TaxID=3387274 RepID=UPI003F7ECFD5